MPKAKQQALPQFKNNKGLIIVNITHNESGLKETIRTIANVATVVISFCLLILTVKQLGWI